MRNTVVAAAFAAALAAGSSLAIAQVVIDLDPDVRTEFRQYVVKEKVKPVKVKKELRVDAEVPADITLSPLPPFIVERYPDYATYRYVTVDDRIYVVHPGTRKVVTVID